METATYPESVDESGSLVGAIVGNPVVQTLFVMAAVSLATWTGAQAGNLDPFVLQAPFDEAWWQLPLSVYAHSGPAHLFANATAIVVAGGLISLSTSRIRFHLFFLVAGMLSGAAHVAATGFLGTPTGVLGASGAAFALIGYVVTGNPVSSRLLGGASIRAVLAAVLGVALLLTIYSAGVNIANVGHFAGAILGLVAGHLHLLRVHR